jgi:hypothetical protein
VLIGILNSISALLNSTFLYLNRDCLLPTQRLAPWILISATLQSARCFVLAGLGETELSTRVFDTFSAITVFCGVSYFVFYVLLLLRQAHVVAGKKFEHKYLVAYYVMHFLLIPFAIMDLIVKNIVHHTFSTGIKYGYYAIVMGVVFFLVDYGGIKVIRFAQLNARMMKDHGTQSPEANLNPLKKTLIFFSCVCTAGVAAFFYPDAAQFEKSHLVS